MQGLGIDVQHFKKTWLLTTNLAITGTILPCLLGWLLIYALGNTSLLDEGDRNYDLGLNPPDTLEGFAAGTALSSTSIGMSLMMLIQFDYLKTPLGGIIAVAAMIDDVASLVILAVLGELRKGEKPDANGNVPELDSSDWAWLAIKPILISLGIIAAGAFLCAIVPGIYRSLKIWCDERGKRLASKIGSESGKAKAMEDADALYDQFVITGLLVVTFGMVIAAGYSGSSYLLGAFAAGMAFSQIPGKAEDDNRANELWGNHASLSWWLASICFVRNPPVLRFS